MFPYRYIWVLGLWTWGRSRTTRRTSSTWTRSTTSAPSSVVTTDLRSLPSSRICDHVIADDRISSFRETLPNQWRLCLTACTTGTPPRPRSITRSPTHSLRASWRGEFSLYINPQLPNKVNVSLNTITYQLLDRVSVSQYTYTQLLSKVYVIYICTYIHLAKKIWVYTSAPFTLLTRC